MGKWSSWTVSFRRSRVCSPVAPSPASGKSSANPTTTRGTAAAAAAIAASWQRVGKSLRSATSCCCCWPRWKWRSADRASGSCGGLERVAVNGDEWRPCGSRPSCSANRAVKTGCTRSYLILFNFVFLVSCRQYASNADIIAYFLYLLFCCILVGGDTIRECEQCHLSLLAAVLLTITVAAIATTSDYHLIKDGIQFKRLMGTWAASYSTHFANV